MKISINMGEVKTAICEYLKNELSIPYVNPDMIVFQNARSIEDMGFEVVLTSPSKTIKIIPDAVEENNAKFKNTSSTRETRVSRSKEENVEISKNDEEEETNGKLSEDSTEPEEKSVDSTLNTNNNALTEDKEPNLSYEEKDKKENETNVEALTDDNPFSSVFSGLKF